MIIGEKRKKMRYYYGQFEVNVSFMTAYVDHPLFENNQKLNNLKNGNWMVFAQYHNDGRLQWIAALHENYLDSTGEYTELKRIELYHYEKMGITTKQNTTQEWSAQIEVQHGFNVPSDVIPKDTRSVKLSYLPHNNEIVCIRLDLLPSN
jgi:hypothetical protein